MWTIKTFTKEDLIRNKYASEVKVCDFKCDMDSIASADIVVYWDGERPYDIKNRFSISKDRLAEICRAIYD